MKKLFIVIPSILILGAIAYAGVQLYQNKNIINPIVSKTLENKDENKNTQISSSKINTNSTLENIYKNTEFGIQITLPQEMTDYKTIVKTINNGLSYIDFYTYRNTGCGIDVIEAEKIIDNGKCYEYDFRLDSMTESDYFQTINDRCVDTDGPSCPDGFRDFVRIGDTVYQVIGSYQSIDIKDEYNSIIDSLKPLDPNQTVHIYEHPAPNYFLGWSNYYPKSNDALPFFSLSYPHGAVIDSKVTNELNGVKSKGISFNINASKRYNNPNLKVIFSVLYTNSEMSQGSCGKVDRMGDFFLTSYSPKGGSSGASQVVEDGKTYSHGYYFDQGMGSETSKEVYAFYKNRICYGVMRETTFIRVDAKQDYTSTDRDNIEKDFKKFRDSLVIN